MPWCIVDEATLIHHQENKKTSLSPEGQGVRIVVRATK
jgi:hypothetical protein